MQSKGALLEPVVNVRAFNFSLHSGIGHDQVSVEEPRDVWQGVGGADCCHGDRFALHNALGFQGVCEDWLAEFVNS